MVDETAVEDDKRKILVLSEVLSKNPFEYERDPNKVRSWKVHCLMVAAMEPLMFCSLNGCRDG